MVQVVVVRHGEKQYSPSHERDWGLTLEARQDAVRLREVLANADAKPDLVITSKWRHAVETAKMMAGESPACPVIEVAGLTPYTADTFFTWSSILQEVRDAPVTLSRVRTVVLVAHHDRTVQIARALTGLPAVEEILKLEALVLRAVSLRALWSRRGVVVARLHP